MTATATPIPSAGQRVVLREISWQTYESLLRELEGQHLRLTYDRGALEIMSPSPRHAKVGKLIARLVETFTLELNIPLVGLGNTTWRSESLERGLEADECYYVARADWAAGREDFDLTVDPPPDLAIEVDISSSSLKKREIYAALGVPELWRYEDDKLTIFVLSHKEYAPALQSLNLPTLPPAVIEQFVRQRTKRTTDTAIVAEFAAWVRHNIKKP